MTSTSSGPGPLTLPFEPRRHKAASNLQSEVQRIISQKGAFRNVSEASLRAEYNESTKLPPAGPEVTDVVESNKDETPKKRQEKLWKSRDEMLQKLDYVQNEVLSALDFVSLLLSSQSVAAQASMSPALKQMAPSGSVEARTLKERPLHRATVRRLEEASQGWKSNSYKSAAVVLETASNRLDTEAKRQSMYWEQVADLKSYGWPVSRLPNDSRAIVVHYGFPEAALQYRNRGISILRQNELGDLELDQKFISAMPKRLVVSIVRDGEESETFTSTVADKGPGEHQVFSSIIQARDSLFQEELFYEILREARLIANQGVISRVGVVEIAISEGFQINIALSDGISTSANGVNATGSLAEMVAVHLQLLLTLEHQKSYQRRSTQNPVPMLVADRRIAEYALLRPLIAQIRHHITLGDAKSHLLNYQKLLLTAGLQFNISTDTSLQTILPETNITNSNEPVLSTLTLDLPSKRSVTITFETYLGAPIYGHQFLVSSTEYFTGPVTSVPMRTINELMSSFQYLLTVDLLSTISEMELHDTHWSAILPYAGRLDLLRRDRTTVTLQIKCQEERIALRVQGDDPKQEDVFIWTKDELWRKVQGVEEGGSQDTFRDIMNMLTTT